MDARALDYAMRLWRAGLHPETIEELAGVSRSTMYRARTALPLLAARGLLAGIGPETAP